MRVSGSRAGNAGEVADAVALKEVCSSGTSTSSSRSAAPAMPNAQATAMAVVRLSTNIIQGRTAPARSLRKLFWNHWLFCASAGVPRLTATLSDQGSSLCCPPACEAFNYQRKIDFDICFFFPPRTAAENEAHAMMLLTREGTHDQLMSRAEQLGPCDFGLRPRRSLRARQAARHPLSLSETLAEGIFCPEYFFQYGTRYTLNDCFQRC